MSSGASPPSAPMLMTGVELAFGSNQRPGSCGSTASNFGVRPGRGEHDAPRTRLRCSRDEAMRSRQRRCAPNLCVQRRPGDPAHCTSLQYRLARALVQNNNIGGVPSVGIIETSAALGACLLVLTISVVLDRRPYRPGKRNYIPVMIIALAASLVLGRHLLSLLYM